MRLLRLPLCCGRVVALGALALALLLPAAAVQARAPLGPWGVGPAVAGSLSADLKAQQERTNRLLAARAEQVRRLQTAQQARERAAARVSSLKTLGNPPALQQALKDALVHDEAAARARATVAAADAEVAREGARLLRLYDAVLAERRRALQASSGGGRARADVVAAYQGLVAQRDAVRQALLPVLGAPCELGPDGAASGGASAAALSANDDDDVETLLEKADLARDLEARYARRAAAVRERIRELQEEASVARDVAGLVGRDQLFDEEDRRLMVVRSDLQGARAVAPGQGGGQNDANEARSGGGGGGPPLSLNDNSGAPEFDAAPNVGAQPVPGGVTAPGPGAGAAVGGAGAVPTFGTAERPFLAGSDTTVQGLLLQTNSLDELKQVERQLQAEMARLKQQRQTLKKAANERGR